MSATKKKPKLTLIGIDGNAYNILWTAKKVLEKAGYSEEEQDDFYAEATSGNYDKLLQTCMKWFDIG